jgi:hypothetical protein
VDKAAAKKSSDSEKAPMRGWKKVVGPVATESSHAWTGFHFHHLLPLQEKKEETE